MQLSQLIQALRERPEASLAFVLPDGQAVPTHFHVTEVGRVRKDFIDCGGTVRSTDRCVLQVWVATDSDHRLVAGKLDKIIALAKDILSDEDLPVEVEYDVGVITQLSVAGVNVGDNQITLQLVGKHTACLAPDKCGVESSPASAKTGCCTPSPADSQGVATKSGCCTPSPAGSLGVVPKSGCC